eukprot:5564889-Alexandrium_andersonii.AAC.1
MTTTGPSVSPTGVSEPVPPVVESVSGSGTSAAGPGPGGGSGPSWVAGGRGCPRQVRWHLPAWVL